MRKIGLLVSAIIIFCLFTGCRLNIAPQYDPQKANEKYHVIVKYFDLDKWSSNYEGNIDFQKRIAEYIAGNLQKKGISAIAISANEPVNNAKYIIQGKIDRMDTGRWWARFWIGFGVGAGRFGAKAQLIDVATGSTVQEFQDFRSCDTLNGDEGILECGCIETSEDVVNKFFKFL